MAKTASDDLRSQVAVTATANAKMKALRLAIDHAAATNTRVVRQEPDQIVATPAAAASSEAIAMLKSLSDGLLPDEP